ncbi:hypothetical protein H6503_06230 [Candidatus Woesearchaeota archaeon]|nr:hypothetical protein [Candidatus Woesearchaeota archaeon]
MGYLNDLYFRPANEIAKDWKRLLAVTVIEAISIVIMYLILTSAYNYLERESQPLADADLSNNTEIMDNVGPYNDFAHQFVSTFYIVGFFAIMFAFIVYTFSRWMIWRILLKKEFTFLKTIAVDFVLFLILLILFSFAIKYVIPEYYSWYIAFAFLPLLYYSFFCHLNLDKSFKEVFSYAWSVKMFNLLPHVIVAGVIASYLSASIYTLVLSLLILNLFRMFAINIVKN